MTLIMMALQIFIMYNFVLFSQQSVLQVKLNSCIQNVVSFVTKKYQKEILNKFTGGSEIFDFYTQIIVDCSYRSQHQ